MRTRFAPSPTGYLHVGGLRTALYAYLVAKQTGGQFLLRIEDTDREREVAGAVEQILKSLRWAGMDPDEGVVLEGETVGQKGTKGPYVQSQRLDMYKQYAEQLLKDGHAYRCFCTPQRLEQMRTDQSAAKQAPMYDRLCMHLSEEEVARKLSANERHVIRLKVPREEVISFEDDIRGQVSFQGHTIDDQVLMKGDGFPTYHLAHVVDDHFMDIDIVIRGEEWLSSLPKHLILWKAFGWQVPRYAHLPLLLNADRSKLSKRQGDVSSTDYESKGYLPEAMLNFIAFLGWNPGTTQELFTIDELVEQFSIERVQKAGAVFDLQKLDWLQGQWIRKLPLPEFSGRIHPLTAEKFPAAKDDAAFMDKAKLIQDRILFFHEAPDMLGFFYEDPAVSVELLANKKQKVEVADLPKLLEIIRETLEGLPVQDWTDHGMLEAFKKAVEAHQIKLGQLLWPLRALLTGREFSPGAVEVATALGKDIVFDRLAKTEAQFKNS
jgi:nondiscriminating glutamyl-tRNA synthetase